MNKELYTIVDAIEAVLTNKRLIIVTWLSVVLIVGAVTLLSEKSYVSDAKIYARLGRENSAIDATSGMGERAVFALPMNRESEMNSIAAMIDSKDLFGTVVDLVGAERILKKLPPASAADFATTEGQSDLPAKAEMSIFGSVMNFLATSGVLNNLDARERAIIDLQKNVMVQVNKLSHIVSVSYESHDPALAQEVVHGLVDQYVKQYTRTHRPDRGIEFLEQQTEQAAQDLQTSEEEFEKFKTESGLVSMTEQKKLYVERIARLENELLDTAAQLRANEAEVETLEEMLASISPVDAVSETAGSGNDAIDGMRRDLYQLQLYKEELAAKYNPDHPRRKAVQEKLNSAEKIFAETEAKLVERVEGPSRVFEGAKLQLVQRRPQLDALRNKHELLTTQLRDVKAEMSHFNDSETRFLRLQRRYELHNDNYVRLEKSLQQARLDYAMQDNNVSNLSVFQPASINPKPSRPNKMVNLLLGIVMGMGLGCALAVVRDYRAKILLPPSEKDSPGPPSAVVSGAKSQFIRTDRPQPNTPTVERSEVGA